MKIIRMFILKSVLVLKMTGKSKVFICICFMVFLNPHYISAQGNNKMQEIFLLDKNDFNPYVAFQSDDITNFFSPEESSSYPSVNLFDGYLKTCWVAGSSKTNRSSALYIKLPDNIDPDKVILNIFNGYGKSQALYYSNSRPKKAKISVFAAFYPEGFSTEVVSLYLIKKYPVDIHIELADTFGVQSFPLQLDKNALFNFQKESIKECSTFSGENYERFKTDEQASFTPSFIMKLEIEDSYEGNRYDDICISEIFFNDRFITDIPIRYNQINEVFIRDDNTLLVDYADQNGVPVYKDTSATFTMIDWPQHANWAVLHYVRNDEVGEGSRVEELYSLIDLKNRTVVDRFFQKCTGIYPMYLMIEKNEDGKVIIDNGGEINVELK